MSEFFSLELLPDEPILIGSISASFRLKDELDSYLSQIQVVLDGLEQPVYYIADFSAGHVSNFNDFLVATNRVTRESGALIKHSNIIETIIVSTDRVLQLGAKGLDSKAFGHLSVPVFDTLEEALAYSREQIRQW